MKKEFQIFDDYIQSQGLRRTPQRRYILEVFLETEKHLCAEELYKLVKQKFSSIGYVTVYRTLRILSAAGLCSELDTGDGVVRYEHKYNHKHHDHLICQRCGKFTEVVDPRIEKLQEEMAKKYSFDVAKHKLEIFGICQPCCLAGKKPAAGRKGG